MQIAGVVIGILGHVYKSDRAARKIGAVYISHDNRKCSRACTLVAREHFAAIVARKYSRADEPDRR